MPISNRQPAIRPVRGVISASPFGGSETIGPGSWIEIYGSNLANTAREWHASDFKGDTAPTSLNDVAVAINGRSAFVSYISPGQVNAQVPSDLQPGPMEVTVTNDSQTSNGYPIKLAVSAPGILAISEDVAYTYALAVFPDYYTYALPQLKYPSIPPAPPLPSRLPKPGDTIIVFGIGFGEVMPSVRAGQIANGPSSVHGNLEVLFNGRPAQITYAGLAPGLVGLYQFNVVIPEGARGESRIEVQLNATPVAQTKLYVALQ